MKYILLVIILSSICLSNVVSQATYAQTDNKLTLKQAEEYLELSLFGQARSAAAEYLKKNLNSDESISHNRRNTLAKNIFYISGLRLGLAESESELKNYIASHIGNPNIIDAIFEMGDYCYNDKRYDESIYYFDLINKQALSVERKSELIFKKGYCHFVKKEFPKAQYEFAFSRNIRNKFFYPINYYDGMCEYFTGDYKEAVSSFQRVEGSSVYSKHIPYYVSQIYFKEKDYDKLINYGERVINEPGIKKIPEIRQLLGQTYFLRNDFKRALPHLEYYEKNTHHLTIEEFYQLGFAQYSLGDFSSAIENFLEINREETKLGQIASYYLADCYINTGDLTSARAAFKKVSQMKFDQSMTEEAKFNYGKLSSQMGFEREAINILLEIPQSNRFFKETQSIINDILVNTEDYDNAISITESLPSLSPQLQKTFQSITFNRALQHLTEGNEAEAIFLFDKSNTYPIDPNINTQTSYWRGYIDMSNGNHSASLNHYNTYFEQAKKADQLPEESAVYMANYNQGYNHLKIEEYYFAVDQFQFAIDLILNQKDKITNTAIIDRILPDAYIRAGDCLFKEKRYKQAQVYYDGAIEREKGDYIYALYQRALIEGLEKDNYSKIVTLEQIIDEHPTSEYADDAMLQLGDTYLSTNNPLPAANVYFDFVNKYKGKSNLVNQAYLKLGLIAYNEGDPHKALEFYKEVFENNPNPEESQEAMVSIEEIYIDDLAKGEEFIRFVDSLPGYEVNAFERDSLTYKAGENKYFSAEYEEAIVAFDNYLSRYSKGYYRLNAHYYRADALTVGKKYGLALKDYQTIISEGISDYYGQSLYKAAIISYNYTQNFNRALEYYSITEEYTENEENKFQAQLGAMRSAFRLGKNKEVLYFADKVIKNKLSSQVEKSAALYYLGKTSFNQDDWAKAIEAFEQVSNLSNNNQAAEARHLIALGYYLQKNIDKAEQKISTGNEKNRAYPFWIAKNLLLQGQIFIDKDDLLNARAAVEAVQENFDDDQNLIKEANELMQKIEKAESLTNRIKIENVEGILELDTTGN